MPMTGTAGVGLQPPDEAELDDHLQAARDANKGASNRDSEGGDAE